jgi:hypothetical protein
MNDMDEKLIDEKLKLIYLTIESNHKETTIKQDHILEQVLETNGRVTSLEQETLFTRFFTKNPKIFVFTIIGFLVLTNLDEVGPVIKAVLNLFS